MKFYTAILLLLLLMLEIANAADKKLMIFGGKGHNVYLGCLNCSQTASDSIFNSRGQFGSCSGIYVDNLFCRGIYKEYGRKGIYSDQSACSTNAGDPPVIVDSDGDYYGRFSIGGTWGHKDSVCSNSIYGRFGDQRACELVKCVCDQ